MNFARDCCFFSWLDAASEQSGGKTSRSSDTLGCNYRLPTGRKSVGDYGDSLETHKEVSHGGRCAGWKVTWQAKSLLRAVRAWKSSRRAALLMEPFPTDELVAPKRF